MSNQSAQIKRYFESVRPSLLGPYMMEGFGFPESAGAFRFQEEQKIVMELLDSPEGAALDLGAGTGLWSEWFSSLFDHVDAIEYSRKLFAALEKRCQIKPNIRPHLCDVLTYIPDQPVDFVFTGGLLMYLKDSQCLQLFKNLSRNLNSNTCIICRESTARGSSQYKQGDYCVIYRSIDHYHRLFRSAGLEIKKTRLNTAYELMQIGCEMVKSWKNNIPEAAQALPVVGATLYWALRATSPWLQNSIRYTGVDFPKLQNHFFLLKKQN